MKAVFVHMSFTVLVNYILPWNVKNKREIFYYKVLKLWYFEAITLTGVTN